MRAGAHRGGGQREGAGRAQRRLGGGGGRGRRGAARVARRGGGSDRCGRRERTHGSGHTGKAGRRHDSGCRHTARVSQPRQRRRVRRWRRRGTRNAGKEGATIGVRVSARRRAQPRPDAPPCRRVAPSRASHAARGGGGGDACGARCSRARVVARVCLLFPRARVRRQTDCAGGGARTRRGGRGQADGRHRDCSGSDRGCLCARGGAARAAGRHDPIAATRHAPALAACRVSTRAAPAGRRHAARWRSASRARSQLGVPARRAAAAASLRAAHTSQRWPLVAATLRCRRTAAPLPQRCTHRHHTGEQKSCSRRRRGGCLCRCASSRRGRCRR
jgi:hypothetical protein